MSLVPLAGQKRARVPELSGPAPVVGRQRRGWRHHLARWGVGLIVPIAIIAIWQIAIETEAVPPTLIASPWESFSRFVELTRDGTLIEHGLISLRRLALGFLIGSTLGITFGALIGATRIGRWALEPTALTLIPVPAVAWIPLLVVIFGIEERSKIALVAIGSLTTLLIATSAGVRNTPQSLVEVARVFGRSRRELVFRVLLPSAVPSIVAALRVSLALSWTLLVAAEVIASADGLGWFIWDSRTFARSADMSAAMIAIGVLGWCTDALVARAGKHLTRWDRAYGDEGNRA